MGQPVAPLTSARIGDSRALRFTTVFRDHRQAHILRCRQHNPSVGSPVRSERPGRRSNSQLIRITQRYRRHLVVDRDLHQNPVYPECDPSVIRGKKMADAAFGPRNGFRLDLVQSPQVESGFGGSHSRSAKFRVRSESKSAWHEPRGRVLGHRAVDDESAVMRKHQGVTRGTFESKLSGCSDSIQPVPGFEFDHGFHHREGWNGLEVSAHPKAYRDPGRRTRRRS